MIEEHPHLDLTRWPSFPLAQSLQSALKRLGLPWAYPSGRWAMQ